MIDRIKAVPLAIGSSGYAILDLFMDGIINLYISYFILMISLFLLLRKATLIVCKDVVRFKKGTFWDQHKEDKE